MKRRWFYCALVFILACGLAACGGSGAASSGSSGAETAKKTRPGNTEFKKGEWIIGFTNSFNGNTFRQTEEKNFFNAVDILKADGQIKEVITLESNNDVNAQITHIQDLIMRGVDAIIIDPSSGSALNGAIKEAYDAGIPVIITNDGPVTSEFCYQLNYDTIEMASKLGNYLIDRLGKNATWLVCRGVAGNPCDEAYYAGYVKSVKDSGSNIKFAAEVYCNWSHTIAQTEITKIIASLPKIDAVATEGGDDYGSAMAFTAAGLKVPLIVGQNRGYFLHWWYDQYKKNGYTTLSASYNPSSTATSLYIIVDILNGFELKNKEIIYPYVTITQDDLEKFQDVPDDAVACVVYSQKEVREKIVLPNAAN
jgi:ribose transport system substrate-binding protein